MEEQQSSMVIKEEMEIPNEIHLSEDMAKLKENIKNELIANDTDSPFQNIHVEIKLETTIEPRDSNSENESSAIVVHSILSIERDKDTMEDNSGVQVKEEVNTNESRVSFDYTNFDDCGSMNSDEATALGNVEACLQDEINIKYENEGNYDMIQKEIQCEEDIKMEPDITLPETNLTPNTSAVTLDGECVKTTSLIVVKIPGKTIIPTKIEITNPEEIVPTNCTSYDDDSGLHDDMCYDDPSYDDGDTKVGLKTINLNSSGINTSFEGNNSPDMEAFQLNSITGNVLSLEQEAYLMETNGKIADPEDRPYKCRECPKSYVFRRGLKRHLEVHKTIEKRALGVLKGIQSRKEKRLANLRQEKNESSFGKVLKRHSRVHRSMEKNALGVLKSTQSRKDRYLAKLPKEEHETVPIDEESPEPIKEGYTCTCGKVFQRRSRMETCLRSHDFFESDASCVSCITCTKQFKSKDELTLHRKRLHRKKFPCKFCPTGYDSRKELFKHLQVHQKVQLMEYKVISEVMKGNQKLYCFMCSKMCTDLSELKTHVMTDHKGPYLCSHCKNTFPKIIDFANHTKTYHPEVEGQSVLAVLEAFSKLIQAWKCVECDLQFLDPDKLALHEVEAHSPELKADPQFQCTDCRRVFVSQKGLTSHRRVHHSETVEEPKELPQGIMCLECRKFCKDMEALTSHMRLHSPDRKYPCKFCDFRFATPEKRKTHAEIHTGDMKYVCFICEYQCTSENRLKNHKMSLKHANMKEYLLTGKPLVEESTSEVTKDSRKKEKGNKNKKLDKERTEDKESGSRESDSVSGPSEVACDVCGEKFPSENEMQNHKETHPFIEIPSGGDEPTRIFFK